MLWSEFKALVDEKLNNKDPEIMYIDTNACLSEMELDIDEQGFLRIT